MNFNKNWLKPFLVFSCFIEAYKEYSKQQKEEKEYQLKLEQNSKEEK